MKNNNFINLQIGIWLICCLPLWSIAQLHIDGAVVYISADANLHSEGHISNSNNATFTNDGILSTNGNIQNQNGATLQGNGLYSLEGDWQNSAIFNMGTASVVNIHGDTHSEITSAGHPIYWLLIDKDAANVHLNDDTPIANRLFFFASNNKLLLNGNTLSLWEEATIAGHDESSYIITGSDGEVVKSGLSGTSFTFPIGHDEFSYNPISITQNGAADIGVRCLAQHYENGLTGNAYTSDAVDASWQLTQASAGDNDLDVQVQWHISHELGFDRENCAIGLWDGSSWDHGTIDGSSANGSGTVFEQNREGITAVGILGVRSGMGLVDLQEIGTDQTPLRIYPNPFSNKLYVLNAQNDIQLFDLTGRLVFQQSVHAIGTNNSPVKLDLSTLPNGSYILKSQNQENQLLTIKIIKMSK